MNVGMQIIMMPLSEIAPADYNPRTITEHAMRGLEASLARFGLVEPLIWNRTTKRLVGGHQRLLILRKHGVEKAPVIQVDLPESEEKALNLTLNNTAIMGDFTEDASAILTELSKTLGDAVSDLRLQEIDLSHLHLTPIPNLDASPQLGKLIYRVIVDCSGEKAQADLLRRLESEGFVCRALIS